MKIPLLEPELYPHAILKPWLFQARISALPDDAGFEGHELLALLRILEISEARRIVLDSGAIPHSLLQICHDLAKEEILRPFSVYERDPEP